MSRIKLVKINNRDLFKDINGLFRLKDTNRVFKESSDVMVMNGAVESSNVNAVGEMTNLIDLQRQFEMQVKMMSTVEEMDKASNLLLRTS